MLKVFASELNDQKYLAEANTLRKMVESKLTRKWDMNGKSALSVMYANKRYFIPFGWFVCALINYSFVLHCIVFRLVSHAVVQSSAIYCFDCLGCVSRHRIQPFLPGRKLFSLQLIS
jgi:hypothetical protein